MARIEPVRIEEVEGRARELLDEVVARGGDPGPMTRAMATAPALLRGYLDLSHAMKRSHIDRPIIERINLAVHGHLRCDYCIAAHTEAARGLGVAEIEIELALRGASSDPAIAALLEFALRVLTEPSTIGDADFERLHGFGFGNEQIAEVAGLVSLQLLTGSFNLMADIHARSG